MVKPTTIALAVMLVRAVMCAESASAAPPAPKTPVKLVTIKEIKRTPLADGARITIELDGEVPFRDVRIPDPSRVFVDMRGTRAIADLVDRTLRFDEDAQVVRQVRVGRHPNNTTRVVLDAIGVTSYSVYPLYNPYRVVIDCVGGDQTSSGETAALSVPPSTAAKRESTRTGAAAPPLPPPPPALSSHWATTAWIKRPPSVSARKGALLADARADVLNAASESGVDDSTVAATVGTAGLSERDLPVSPAPAGSNAVTGASAVTGSGAVTGPSAATGSGAVAGPAVGSGKNAVGYSMARQLGLGVSRIVIDPGHGGHDSGAQGKGVTEAELVLDVALRLEKLLQKSPGTEVILTRRTDEFIALQERTAMANREGADLFLSIHANASPSPQARGVETYFLNFANNLSAAAVAARENGASGQAMNALPDLVKTIALNNKLDESRDFATEVQHAMLERLRASNKTVKSLGVKQAPFVVLIGAAMPSVLAEISFVTNPQEARLLKSGAYRQHIAEALNGAVRKYQSSLAHATTARAGAGREAALPRAEPEHDAGESHPQRNRERE
jgi:N-acetylmuramoyl-L-alanine amidase